MMRWIGGFSHVLPFVQGSFDFVFANAALHHMRDIPGAIFEMLRVLRPGGYLISTSDPYRADASGERHELRVVDDKGKLRVARRFADRVDALKRRIVSGHP